MCIRDSLRSVLEVHDTPTEWAMTLFTKGPHDSACNTPTLGHLARLCARAIDGKWNISYQYDEMQQGHTLKPKVIARIDRPEQGNRQVTLPSLAMPEGKLLMNFIPGLDNDVVVEDADFRLL